MVDSLSLSNFDFPEDEFEDSGSAKESAMNKYATFGVFQLVGNGVKTNEWCGRFSSYRGLFALICIRESIFSTERTIRVRHMLKFTVTVVIDGPVQCAI